ncbi:MAG: hypothetical protein MUE78_04365, partial [Ilumatobacteraceae bacterium]|nr:hypothetical protein [Ilumatobacteraceae bacterium]
MRLLARAVALVAVLVSIPLVAVPPTRPAAAAAELTASKSAPSSVLAGEAVPFTLTAANPGDAPEFNLTFRDVLPLGISYAGPTSPALAGEPRIVENDVEFPPGSGRTVPQQTLIWENVADLQSGDSLAIEFAVALNDGTDPRFPEGPAYPVGATLTNTGEVYASPDARAVPRFDAAGVPIPDVRIDSASASSGTTQVSAIRITKAEPSPEGELLRGVHDFATTYTLTVEVTGEAGVDGVAVTDLLPAELELLACGGVDNSAPGTEEYTGSGRLGVGLADPACRLPDLVETVVD